MKVLSVDVINFRSFYGSHKFNLADRGLTLIMGDNQDEPRMDSNGSGKSSLVSEAVDWCWWGIIPSGDHAESLFNEEAFLERGSKSRVVTHLENDQGEPVIIDRWRSKSAYELHVSVGGEKLGTLDVNETQKVVDKVLGLDREVGHAAILFGQNDLTHYADAKDAPRMEILTKILQLGEIDHFLERAKAKIKTSVERKAKLQTDLASVEGHLRGIRPEELDAQIARWTQEHQQNLANYQQAIAAKIQERQSLVASNVDLSALRMQKIALDQGLHDMRPPGDPPELGQLESHISLAGVEVGRVSGEHQGLATRLTNLQRLGAGLCSECGQPITVEHLQTEAQTLSASLQQAATFVANAKAQLTALEGSRTALKAQGLAAHDAYRTMRDEKLSESVALGGQIKVAETESSRALLLDRESQRLQAELAGCQSAGNPFIEQKQIKEKERYDLERKQGQIQYELEALEADARYLEFWVKGFGPQGLKSYILDSRLQELTDAANEWVSLLTGGTIWVRFEAQKQTRGKKLVNAPDVRVFRWNPDGSITERSYKSWSGGEKKRISFAIDFGLSRLVARRAKQTYDLLILDEVFKHLDRSGKEAVMEMLQLLSREKSSLIVVEHDTEFQGQFERKVLVTKRNRRSIITEENGHGIPEKTQAEKGVSANLSGNPDSKRVPVREPVRRPVS